MSFFKEFKAFALRGNVIDLAIGVIIGAAFGKIISSLVGDVLMPVLGVALSNVNFSSLGITLKEASGDHPAVVLKYGAFIQSTIDFILVAFMVFIAIKLINRIAPKAPEAPASLCTHCLMVIPKDATRCGHCCSDVPR